MAQNQFFMYHPENSRDGTVFNEGSDSKEFLESQGWVDNPALFGHDPRLEQGLGGADPQALYDEKLRKERAPVPLKQHEETVAEVEELRKLVAARDAELESIRQKPSLEQEIKESKERELDEASDAVSGGADRLREQLKTSGPREIPAPKPKGRPKKAKPKEAANSGFDEEL